MTITFDADDVAYFDEIHGRRSEALCPKPLQVVFRDLEKVCSKLRVRTRIEAVAVAVRAGVIEPD